MNRVEPGDWSEKSRELAQLLARTALGDRAAFARLYERSSGHLLAVVLRIQRDRALAEDLLQEIYVSVWKAAASFDAARAQPLTWLTQIARHRAIDSLRRANAQPRLESTSLPPQAPSPAVWHRIEERLWPAPAAAAVARPSTPVSLQPDRVLELWWAPEQGKPTSLGLIRADGVTVLSRGRLPGGLRGSGIDHMAVSVEPPGGSPTGQPTGPVVFYGKLQL